MASHWRLLLPRPIRTLPADLAVTAGLTIIAAVFATVPVLDETPLRVIFGLPLVLFLPGYALVAALFPEAGTGSPEDEDGERDGIDGVERVALSFGLSIAVTPLLGLVLNFTPWGIRLGPILVAVGGFTLITTIVASLRRTELPPEDRFTVPYREWLDAGRVEFFEPDSRSDAILNIVLVLSVLIAVASVGYAVAVPKQGEAFTEFYLLTHRQNGSLVASGYPTDFTQGQSKPIVVGVGNHEHHAQNYTWLILEQQVHIVNNTTFVDRQTRLSTHHVYLRANQTRKTNTSIRPRFTGDRQRIAFVLYKGSAPTHPNVSTAYREVHLWVNVSS